jgi:hypothetical protein
LNSGLRWTAWPLPGSTQRVLLTGRDHPLAKRKRLRLSDLHQLECVDRATRAVTFSNFKFSMP